MTLFDISNEDLFRWKNDLYRLVDIKDDTATVVCVGRYNGLSIHYVEDGPEENFNPFAQIEKP